jgi:hypothetical protein
VKNDEIDQAIAWIGRMDIHEELLWESKKGLNY